MNERLAEIMRNHGLHKHISEDCQHRMEMFAELIVHECVQICQNNDWEDQQGWGNHYAKNIKKKFGVE